VRVFCVCELSIYGEMVDILLHSLHGYIAGMPSDSLLLNINSVLTYQIHGNILGIS